MFSKKKPVTINLTITAERAHCPTFEPSRGTVNLTCDEELKVQNVVVFWEASFVLIDGTKVDQSVFFTTAPVVVLASKQGGVLSIPKGTHPVPFLLPPLNAQVTTTSVLPDRMVAVWKLVVSVALDKSKQLVRAEQDVYVHAGRQLAISHAPSSVVLSKQKFLTHSPIQYQATLHKTVFISEEVVALTLHINNGSRMALLSMECVLKQDWEAKKRIESQILLRLSVNSDPLFPLAPGEEYVHPIPSPSPHRRALVVNG